MENSQQKSSIELNNPISSDESGQHISSFKMRNYLTKIGIVIGLLFMIAAGLAIGTFSRLYYEPHLIKFKFDGFSASLPFAPSKEELNGIPPFSNRKIIRYSSAVSADLEYQILVMEPEEKAEGENLDLNAPASDAEMERWTQSTIAVLCADDSHAISKNCLEKGSRISQWHLTTSDGLGIWGSIFRTRRGQLIQLLATGTGEDEARLFFSGFQKD